MAAPNIQAFIVHPLPCLTDRLPEWRAIINRDMTQDDYINSSALKLVIYHEDETVLQKLMEWTRHFYPHLDARFEDHLDFHNDAPLELEINFQTDEQADEWLATARGKGSHVTRLYARHDYLTKGQFAVRNEQTRRLATVAGPWLDGPMNRTPEGQDDLYRILFSDTHKASIRERRRKGGRIIGRRADLKISDQGFWLV